MEGRRATTARLGGALLLAVHLVAFVCLPILHAVPVPNETVPVLHADGTAADRHSEAGCALCRLTHGRFVPEPARTLELGTGPILDAPRAAAGVAAVPGPPATTSTARAPPFVV